MKKRALRKDFRVEIKKSLNRFLSIFFIVALGVAFFSGIQSAAPDMRATGDWYFDDSNLMDLRVISTLGLTEADLEAIGAVEGAAQVNGCYMEDVYCGEGETQEVLHVESLPADMNRLVPAAGELPQKAGDCFLDETYAKRHGYQPGDRIAVEVTDEDGSSLRRRSFTVSGYGYSPCYISFEKGSTTLGTGAVAGIMYVLPADFDAEVYSVAYVTAEGALGETAFTDGYDALVEALTDRVEKIAGARCEIRYDEVMSEAESELAEARAEVEDGKQELADAQQELEDGKAEAQSELAEAESELLDGEAQLADGEQEMSEAESELADGEAEIAEAEQEIADNEQKLSDGRAQMADGQSTLADGEEQYRSGLSAYTREEKAARAKLIEAQKTIDEGKQALEQGWQEYRTNLAQVEDGQKQLAAAEQELQTNEAQLDAGAAQIADGRTQLDAGERQLAAGQQEYGNGYAQYEAGRQQYEAGYAQYEAGLAAYEQKYQEVVGPLQAAYDTASGQYAELGWKLAEKQTALTEAQASLTNKQNEIKALEEQDIPAAQQRSEQAAAASRVADEALVAANGALQSANSALQSAESEHEAAQTALTQAQTELTQAQTELTKREQKLQKLRNELAAATDEAERERLQKEIAAAEQAVTDQKSVVASAQQTAREKETAKTNAQNARNDAQEKQTVATQKAEEASKTAGQAAQEKSDAEAALNALQTQKKDLSEQIQALPGQIEALNQAKTELEKGQAQALAGMQQAEGYLNVAKGQFAPQKQKLDATAAQLAASKKTLDATEAQLAAAKTELDENAAQLVAAKQELAEKDAALVQARTQLAAGKETLAAKKSELEAGAAALAQAKETLAANEKKLADGQKEIDDGYRELKRAKAKLTSARKELDLGWAQLESSRSQLADGERQLADGRKQLADARADLADGLAQVADGKKELEENRQKLKDGWEEYEEGKKEAEQEIADGEKKIRDAQKDIRDAEQEISDAQDELGKLKIPKWYVNDRNVLPEFTGYGENAERIGNLAKVVPLLFFLVAALISLTTMTRMVEEQRTQIGTLKALGYNKASIASKYLKYAFWATMGGSLFGVLVGEKLLPWVIIHAYGIVYHYLPRILIPYNWDFAFAASAAALLCTIGATFMACGKELAAVPAQLMRPPAPKVGKRIFLERLPFLWRRLSFSWKSTVRNLMRYKKRFLMTVIGIGGCMGLLMVGYGLQDSIMDIGILQFEELQLYDAMVILDADASASERDEALQQLEQEPKVRTYRQFYLHQEDVRTDGASAKKWSVNVMVPQTLDGLSDFLCLRDRETKKEYKLTDEGAVITEKVADELGIRPGDTIALKQEEGEDVLVPIAAVCENYLSHYVYLTPGLYEQVYKKAPEYNSVFFCSDEEEAVIEKIGGRLLEKDAVLNITYTGTMAEQIDNMIGAMDIVMVVLIVSAGMLAVVVLYNLNNININERRRELATLKVLGFYDGEVGAYVYRENILLTVIGAALGVVIGKLLHAYVITTVEVDACMFGRNINPDSFLYGILFTFGFSVLVNFAMYFKLKKIDMVESLKSIE